MSFHFLRVGHNGQLFKLSICLILGFTQISQCLLPFGLWHQPCARRVLRHLIIQRFLFEFFLFLTLELIDVTWHFAVVLVLPSDRLSIIIPSIRLSRRGTRRLPLRWLPFIDGLVHVGFDVVFGLSGVKLGHVGGPWHCVLRCDTASKLLIALLAGQYLSAGVLSGPVLDGVGAGPTAREKGHTRFALSGGLLHRFGGAGLFGVVDDDIGLWLAEVVDGLGLGGGGLHLLGATDGRRTLRGGWLGRVRTPAWGGHGRWFRLPLCIALHLDLLLVSRCEWGPLPRSTRPIRTLPLLLHPELHQFRFGHFPIAPIRLLHGR